MNKLNLIAVAAGAVGIIAEVVSAFVSEKQMKEEVHAYIDEQLNNKDSGENDPIDAEFTEVKVEGEENNNDANQISDVVVEGE